MLGFKIPKHGKVQKRYRTLKWLRSLNVISQEEYHQKYNELRKLILPEKKVIGFEKTTSFSRGFKQEEKIFNSKQLSNEKQFILFFTFICSDC
ncbi:hypothetical protein DMB68_14050 [Flavobacterium hydrophilum]|uniref:Uncharacterized protein n=1 Tax=Flavobacterium hydrophilum TaxID=2211445 RepID=A0A2V4C3A8_9FLAO|nr:hypothetical protein DMB68_14050 [Flavobacterium hydrophilum]